MVRASISAKDMNAWRGARGSADMMNGTGALILRPMSQDIIIEIEGTPEELQELKSVLTAALESELW